MAGDKKPFPLLQSQFTEAYPQVSPDGKWMAYMSTETGRSEIYVKPFPEGPGKWQVSTDGGWLPRWRRDGKELFFYFNNSMLAADIRVMGASLEAGVPRTLFGLGDPSGANQNIHTHHPFAVGADGQRFLVSQTGTGGRGRGGLADQIVAAVDRGGAVAAAANQVTVVLDWTQMLKKK